jgi:hypothetical protein
MEGKEGKGFYLSIQTVTVHGNGGPYALILLLAGRSTKVNVCALTIQRNIFPRPCLEQHGLVWPGTLVFDASNALRKVIED